MTFNTLVDTSVWLALVDEREASDHRDDIEHVYDLIRDHIIVMPWPIAYETLRTRLARRRIGMIKLERELKSPRIEWIDDRPYRDAALKMVFDSGIRTNRPFSMVDCLIRLLLDDRNIKIDYLATWNDRDFEDVCQSRNVMIIC